MIEAKLESANHADSNLSVMVKTRGWVIKRTHHYRQTHECAFKVTEVNVRFDLDDVSVHMYPTNFSLTGFWANSTGRKWFDTTDRLYRWQNSGQNEELLEFEYFPHEVQEVIFKHLTHSVKVLSERMIKLDSILTTNKKFVSKGYVDLSNEPQEGDLPFLPSIKQTRISPLLNNDVKKWKVAREEQAWTPSVLQELEEQLIVEV